MKPTRAIGVTEFRSNYNLVLASLAGGPCLLIQKSRPVAVLASLEEWNDREDEISRLKIRMKQLEDRSGVPITTQ